MSEQPKQNRSLPASAAAFMGVASLFMIATIVLESLILSKGLQGAFVKTPMTASEAQTAGVMSADPVATTGSCLLNITNQGTGNYLLSSCAAMANDTVRYPQCFPQGVPAWHPENNIILKLPNPSSCSVGISETWTISGYKWTYVTLAPGETFSPEVSPETEQRMLKIIRGTLLDINTNGIQLDNGHWETLTISVPNRPISLWIDSSISSMTAGSEGAVFAYLRVSKDNLEQYVTDMNSAPINDVAGPFSENLQWVQVR